MYFQRLLSLTGGTEQQSALFFQKGSVRKSLIIHIVYRIVQSHFAVYFFFSMVFFGKLCVVYIFACLQNWLLTVNNLRNELLQIYFVVSMQNNSKQSIIWLIGNSIRIITNKDA